MKEQLKRWLFDSTIGMYLADRIQRRTWLGRDNARTDPFDNPQGASILNKVQK